MTTTYEPGTIPEFDKADRLKKAVGVSNIPVLEMAEYLGVRPETLSRYLNGKADAPLAIVRLIALRTGVPVNWIMTGDDSPNGPNGDGGAWCARRDSNSQPSDP